MDEKWEIHLKEFLKILESRIKVEVESEKEKPISKVKGKRNWWMKLDEPVGG